MEDEMLRCDNCSLPLKTTLKFCTACGHPAAKAKKRSCPGCNSEVDPSHKFCGLCGKKVDEATPVKVYKCKCGRDNQNSVRFCSHCGCPNPDQLERDETRIERNVEKTEHLGNSQAHGEHCERDESSNTAVLASLDTAEENLSEDTRSLDARNDLDTEKNDQEMPQKVELSDREQNTSDPRNEVQTQLREVRQEHENKHICSDESQTEEEAVSEESQRSTEEMAKSILDSLLKSVTGSNISTTFASTSEVEKGKEKSHQHCAHADEENIQSLQASSPAKGREKTSADARHDPQQTQLSTLKLLHPDLEEEKHKHNALAKEYGTDTCRESERSKIRLTRPPIRRLTDANERLPDTGASSGLFGVSAEAGISQSQKNKQIDSEFGNLAVKQKSTSDEGTSVDPHFEDQHSDKQRPISTTDDANQFNTGEMTKSILDIPLDNVIQSTGSNISTTFASTSEVEKGEEKSHQDCVHAAGENIQSLQASSPAKGREKISADAECNPKQTRLTTSKAQQPDLKEEKDKHNTLAKEDGTHKCRESERSNIPMTRPPIRSLTGDRERHPDTGASSGLFGVNAEASISQSRKNKQIDSEFGNLAMNQERTSNEGTSVDPHQADEQRPISTADDGDQLNTGGANRKSAEAAAPSEGTNETKPEKRQTRSSAFEDKTIDVYFSVVVSRDFKYNHHKHKIFMRGDRPELGNWNKNCVELQPQRSLDEHFVVMGTKLTLPKESLLRKGIQYKYLLWDSSKKNKAHTWEEMYRQRGTTGHTNRALFLDRETLLKLDEWRQYDGVMHKKKGIVSKTLSLLSISERKDYSFASEEQEALCAMLPNLDEMKNTGSFILSEVHIAYDAFKRRLRMHDHFDFDEKFINSCIEPYVTEYVKTLWERLNSGHAESDDQAIRRLTTAVTIVMLCNRYKLDLQDRDFTRPLMSALFIRPTQSGNAYVEYENLINEQFPGDVKKVAEDLCDFLGKMCLFERGICKFFEPRWLRAIPLYHFLCGHSKPGVQIKPDSEHRKEEWWGLLGLEELHERTKEEFSYYTSQDVTKMLGDLKQFFKIDYLLQRTVMAVLSWKHLDGVLALCDIDLNVALACLWYHINVEKYPDFKILATLLQHLLRKAEKEEQHSLTAEENTGRLKEESQVEIVIALGFLDLLTTKATTLDLQYVIIPTVQLVANIFDKFERTVTKHASKFGEETVTTLLDDLSESWKNAAAYLRKWLVYALPVTFLTYSYWSNSLYISDVQELVVIGKILEIHISTKQREWWNSSCLSFLKSRVNRLPNRDKIVAFCLVECDKVHPLIAECFTAIAMEVIETEKRGGLKDLNFIFSYYDSRTKTRFSQILSRLFVKEWPKGDAVTQDEAVCHMLTWSMFKHYLKIFCEQEDKASFFSEECIELITIGRSRLDEVMTDIVKGNVTLTLLEKIAEHAEQFVEIYNLSNNDNKMPVKDIVKTRTLERQAYLDLRSKLAVFEQYCAKLKSVDLSRIEGSMKTDVATLRLDEVCIPIDVAQIQSHSCDQPCAVTAFDAPREVYHAVPELQRLSTSVVFDAFWMGFGHSAVKRNGTLSLEQVLQNVFHPAVSELKVLYEKLEQGSITLEEVDLNFNDFVGKRRDLENELRVICRGMKDQIIMKRLDQIEEYYKLSTYKKGAENLMKVKNSFGLTGDFTTLQTLVDAGEDKEQRLDSVSEDVVKAGQKIKHISTEQADCILALHKSYRLVDWLRTEVKDAKEIKTLVDLAMMSAQGQGSMEVEKVSVLHAAVTGYAPLIYDLDVTAGFDVFLKQCQHVWGSLRADPKLPTKLKETNDNLQWLKNVKESHGSVEVNALTQAANINAGGIYLVGHDKGTDTYSKDYENAIHLALPGNDTEDEKAREYSYSQLCDIQSKLMLVAGKAEQGVEEVERFVEILDGVTRLASVYLKLCSAGCIIFKNWNAKFYCNPESRVHTEIDFDIQSEQILRGYKQDTREVRDEIKSVCEFMEDCFDDWTHSISVQRNRFYYLNNFTTEQVVILCAELARFYGIPNETSPNSERIFHMLDSVKKNCSKDDLRTAMQSAVKDLSAANIDDTGGGSGDPEKDSAETEAESEHVALVARFIEEVTEAGYPEELAKRALVHVGDPNEIGEGLLWCMAHEDDMDWQEAGSSVDPGDHGNDGSDVGIYGDMIQSETLEQLKMALLEVAVRDQHKMLKSRLTDLWLEYTKRSSSTSVADFLSVEHLGYILERLAALEPEADLQRELPTLCSRGKANLIVCPESEVFQVCLSMYMGGNGKQLALPNETEILLCTSNTRYEEVELLLRRALGMHHRGKLFCLLNADRLEYEVGVQVEKFYEINSKGYTDFQLVIVCAREREDKSTIVTAFERFRVKTPILQDTSAICQYIEKHLCVQQTLTPEPAAKLDPTNCTVRVVKSNRAGVGKSLKASRLAETMKEDLDTESENDCCVRINLHRKSIDTTDVLRQLLKYAESTESPQPRLYHIDIAHEVQEGVDDLLFNLVILGSLTNEEGYVWRRSIYDLYVIEALPIMVRDQPRGQQSRRNEGAVRYAHQIFQYLPSLTCWSPTESRDILSGTPITSRTEHDQTMDEIEFRSSEWQRVYQYLDQYDRSVDFQVDPDEPVGDMGHCLDVLLKYCGLRDPSWAELRHFVWFLNIQLQDCDQSVFCDPMMAQDLPGFKQFVVKCMIQMSRDFATRSLQLSEESPSAVPKLDEELEDLEQFQLKRRWESSPHPYVFFNADRNSMTFLGFNISPTGEMVDHQTGQILETNVMPRPLQDALRRNFVPLNENFDGLHRYAKIDKIHRVMGILEGLASYPDESYVLTTDNVKKIMAIYMRFRCGIPVIIMGETGCGKTRLIKFMCDLQKPPDRPDIHNMILMKVHGGTTADDIQKKLKKAIKAAKKNRRIRSHIDTVLFFDEANTTEEIGLIKRVMVDNEESIQQHGLRLVAACNPYRKHSDEMIRRLEQAGLGYHIDASETVDKLGQVPMRRLVYRVQALPQSMLPLVWDFGQLDINTEKQYIQEMVNKCIVGSGGEGEDLLPRLPNLQETLSNILARSQDFMRQQEDECSFVSLRDVERVLRVMRWFYGHREHLYEAMDILLEARRRGDQPALVWDLDSEEESEEENEIVSNEALDEVTRSLILALGVCYHACLEKRAEYRQYVAPLFAAPFSRVDADVIYEEINACQDIFLNELTLEENIARNQALKENVFMMVVCIELRIPLFLVGKPGSSKSLAKTIVADAMQGDASRSELFKEFKSVHMVSYQCSPLATPQGIVGTFKQCADLQKNQNLEKYVSVVVLDEVGLAEDSPRMPLKALHPLLEDGCEGDETPEPYMKVAFIGISNWALDPAKMNRGILVQRGVPDVEELIETARGICASDKILKTRVMPMVEPMAEAYLELYNTALDIREFFGLRDFYSIIKMVYGFSKRSGKPPTWHELLHSILRNFGGLDTIDPIPVFEKMLTNVEKTTERLPTDPDCTPAGLIKACLFGEGMQGIDSESRYLLILIENYAALKILQQQLLQMDDAQYIFGSSFPKDQEYTQVCRNINRIKICMETGQTVVLMNLENLYESLYDALNQYYVYLGGQRFVDLGLGTHRVKCKVHPDFRLIVVAEKQVVYKKFPIPLINRLEKHTLTMETILTSLQLKMARELELWAEAFLSRQTIPSHGSANRRRNKGAQLGDTFIGYERDTAASIVLQVSLEYGEEVESNYIEILEKCKRILLQCATPESVVCLKDSRLREEEHELSEIYHKEQKHDSIEQFLHHFVMQQTEKEIFAQVTTHSKLLSGSEIRNIGERIGIQAENIQMESLQAFDTEQQFCKQIKTFFKKESVGGGSNSFLVLQCDSGDENSTMIASARYNIMEAYRNEYVKSTATRKHVIFIVQLPRKQGGCFIGFEGGKWLSYHIDELRPEMDKLPDLSALKSKPVSELLRSQTTDNNYEVPGDLGAAFLEDDSSENTDVATELTRGPLGTDDVFRDRVVTVDVPEEHLDTSDMSREHMDIVDVSAEHVDTSDVSREHMDTSDVSREHMDTSDVSEGHVDTTDCLPIADFPPVFGSAQEVPSCGMQRNQQSSDHATEKAESRVLDLDQLMITCIHGAAAMLEDGNTRADRKTDRVRILIDLLGGKTSEDLTLMEVLRNRVELLQREKEDSVMAYATAQSWLTSEAASLDSVITSGTLRRSVWNVLEQKVTPLLAGIIAYCDSSANLDLLMKSPSDHWIHRLWLRMLYSPVVTRLKYQDLKSIKRGQELDRIQVRSYGCEGSHFENQLPFSWVIKQKLDELAHHAKSLNTEEQPRETVARLFRESTEGKVVRGCVAEESLDDYMRAYRHDFIRMVYRCQTGNQAAEYELIEQELVKQALMSDEQLNVTGQEAEVAGPEAEGEGRTQPSESQLHFAYSEIQSRVQLFSKALALQPDIVQIITDKNNESGMFSSSTEMTLDVQALLILLETLTPTRDIMKPENRRQDWLEQVEKYRPFIEQMLDSSLHPPIDMHPHGDVCKRVIKKCTCMWARVYALQLYSENICNSATKDEEKFTIDNCMILWKVLGDDTDFKSASTFENVEKLIKICNKQSYKFYLGEGWKCPACEKPIAEVVEMPCKTKHSVCMPCVQQSRALDRHECPMCREDYDKAFEPKLQKGGDRKKLSAYKKYKERCSSFFMEIVSRLCFAGGEPPSDDVIQKLLGYVTKEPGIESGEDIVLVSSELNLFEDTVDPTPAVRSFLLQLLLRFNTTKVREHLGDYFKRGSRVLRLDPSHPLKLCLLFVRCMEDSLYGQYQQEPDIPAAIRFATRLLKQANLDRMTSLNTMEKLEAIASARLGLHITAEWLHKLHCTKEWLGRALREIRQLSEAAAAVCDQPRIKWPRLYLIRLINKTYGMDSLSKISEVPHLQWILPAEARPRPDQNTVPPDRMIVYGNQYAIIKEAVKRALDSGEFQAVEQACDQITDTQKREKIFFLALHREISVYLIENEMLSLPQDRLQHLLDFIQNVDFIENKTLAQIIITRDHPLLSNAFSGGGKQAMIGELLVHFFILLTSSNGNNKLLLPFMRMATDPESMQDAYLPTMPEDHYEEVFRATEKVRTSKKEGENIVMYQCPNGHPYSIGDCGRPYTTSKCLVCGAVIGGAQHQAAQGNTIIEHRGDTTATGHILGDASARSCVPIPERQLSPASTCVLRCLTHMAMYVGAHQYPDEVAAMVTPRVAASSVAQFLLDHTVCDVEVLMRALNKSPDDCCVIVHKVLSALWQYDTKRYLGLQWQSQEGRKKWEAVFSKVIYNPNMSDVNQLIETTTAMMVEDNKKDTNPLLKVLYETDAEVEGARVEGVEESPFTWRFRTRVTTEHLAQIVEENMAAGIRPNCRVLLNFVQQEHLLRAMRFLPDVLRLQQLLIRRFNNSIDGAEANTMTVQELLNRLGEGPVYDEYVELIQSFQQAWILIKQGLTTFVCGNQTVSKEYLNINISNLDEVHLAMLLPSWRGEGVCAVAVVNFLASVQNDFLESYGQIAGVTFDKGVSVRECSAAHLIAYHPEKDLLPLVIATRNYTLLQGQDTQQHHDFETLQKQIEERFIKGKTRIQPDVETVTFREDFTNAKVFKVLSERIPQEALGPILMEDIAREYRHMTDINQSLSLLDITIGYLVSVGKDGDMMLKHFMKEKLTLKKMLHSEQAQRRCRLKHVQSLWCLLSHMKAKELQKLGRDPFDNIEGTYREEVSAEMTGALHTALHHTNVSAFMAELYECIILHINVKQNTQDEDYTPNDAYPLGCSLYEYIAEKNGTALPIWTDMRFPDQLQFKHCAATWQEAYEFQRNTKRP